MSVSLRSAADWNWLEVRALELGTFELIRNPRRRKRNGSSSNTNMRWSWRWRRRWEWEWEWDWTRRWISMKVECQGQVDDGDRGSEFMDGAGNVCYSYGTSYSRILLLCSYSYATTLGWLGTHQTSKCFFVCPLPWMIR